MTQLSPILERGVTPLLVHGRHVQDSLKGAFQGAIVGIARSLWAAACGQYGHPGS